MAIDFSFVQSRGSTPAVRISCDAVKTASPTTWTMATGASWRDDHNARQKAQQSGVWLAQATGVGRMGLGPTAVAGCVRSGATRLGARTELSGAGRGQTFTRSGTWHRRAEERYLKQSVACARHASR